MKKVIAILISLILSLTIVYLLPDFFGDKTINSVAFTNESSIISQKILGDTKENHDYYKLYNKGKLVAVINDLDYFYSLIDKEYSKYEDKFPNTSLNLLDDLYIVDEKSNILFENIDDNIVDYLIDNNLLGVETTAVEFSTSDGIYEIIYVASKNDFIEARDQFFSNFINDETIAKLSNNIKIDSPTSFGTIETGLTIEADNKTATMEFVDAVASPNEIFTNSFEIYSFFCYGRNEERQYYETKQGDTVQAVGYHFGDMTARQIMMLNPDILFNEDQVLAPGTKLNVTYYSSPIEIVVTKQRLAQEVVLPNTPIYKEDDTLKQGTRVIERNESNGVRNVLYEETWINGVVQSGKEMSSLVVEEPIQGIIRVGTFMPPDVGTLNWGWPVDNPIITCNYTCYANHGGVDFQNLYNKWDLVYALDSGVVESTGWTDIGGYYVRINHNNGYKTYYGHFKTYPIVKVGDVVDRGDILGEIGMTGFATGPHVHLAMYYEDELINPCSVLSCNLIKWS